MNIFQKSFSDPVTRRFVPCSRIVAENQTVNSACLIDSRILNGFVGCDFPVCEIREGGWLLLDFGCEITGGIRLVTSGDEQACTLRLRFGESVSEAVGQPTMDHAIHDVQLPIRRFSSVDFGNTGFRFVRLDALHGSIKLYNAIGRWELHELPVIGSLRTSDPLLDQIFDTCVHTVRLNIQDYIVDGVKRDRLVWSGDINPETAVILRVFGDLPILSKTLNLLREHHIKNQFLHGFPSYSLWYLITLHDCWMHTGNMDLLRTNLDYIEHIIRMFYDYVDADGLEQLPPTRFLDWPSRSDPAGMHAGLQALLFMGLQSAAEMLENLGRDASRPRQLAQTVRHHAPDPGGNKAAAALQQIAGMADRRAILESDPWHGVSTYFGYYILLAKENLPALDLVRNYWGAMLKLGATTFWEDFNLDWVPNATGIDEIPVAGRPDIHADFGNYCYKGLRHSLCHGWAAGPAAWCSRRILGVEPIEPGFRKVKITPDLCDLEYAEGTVPTPHGVIKIKLEKGRAPEISVPDGVEVAAFPPLIDRRCK